ncbi:MAG TPA: hypothetical protein DIT95_05710 [Arenibacter sp.]|uniref:PepSY-like domain-containing protein n=1 Tax=Arenibacter sp. NBRC 103722 TaxID=1113929 RepID=UPI000853159A|nr:PepSY-like domain-containing protein [Arenibacter sp. NBRC 103722]HCO83011.1 hypothetical protein [Arenibacter sp.]|tara:strand:+ start:1791 stop:2258 length:468 start_codon:yes stop_codon:yes gene_type:complete
MKIKMAFFIMLLVALQSCLKKVPKAVEDAFLDRFFGAKDLVWAKTPNNDWSATFYIEKYHYITANFSPTGTFEAMEIEIHDDDIPENIVNKIYSMYPDATIFNVFEKNSEKSTSFIFEIENKGQLFGIYFNKDGTYQIIPPDDYRFISRINIEND